MIANAILLSTTNRNTRFLSPAFQATGTFRQALCTAEEREVRRLLDLNATWSDYAVKCVLGVIDAYPLIRARFEEPSRNYRATQLARMPDVLTGGTLENSPQGPAKLARHPVEWPVNPVISLTWLSASHLTLAFGNTTQALPWYMDGTRLALDWPEESGVSGRVNPATPVVDGWTMTITHEPVSCPFAALASVLDTSNATRILLNRRGLTKAWFASDTDAERVAVVALALGLSNKEVYP